jgi:hypothetical protein
VAWLAHSTALASRSAAAWGDRCPLIAPANQNRNSSPTPFIVDQDVLGVVGKISFVGLTRVLVVLPYDRPASPNTPKRRPSAYSAPTNSWPVHVFAVAPPVLLEYE